MKMKTYWNKSVEELLKQLYTDTELIRTSVWNRKSYLYFRKMAYAWLPTNNQIFGWNSSVNFILFHRICIDLLH